MRTVRQLPSTAGRDEAYFLTCWYNMVHGQSVDSHRVRVVNPEYALGELLKIFARGKGAERKQVREEVLEILQEDLVLKGDPYRLPTSRLIQLLRKAEADKEEEHGPTISMARYLIAELQAKLASSYVRDSFSAVEDILVHGGMANDPESQRLAALRSLANALLSTLISRGMSLEALFALSQQILLNEGPATTPRVFRRRWSLVASIVTSPERKWQVVIALQNVTSKEDFPASIGSINFSSTSPIQIDANVEGNRAHAVRAYLRPHGTRLFASVEVDARDPRGAGGKAVERLNRVLNLVRFEYETACVTVDNSFVAHAADQPPRKLPFPTQVPNPSAEIDTAGLTAFVASVDGLVNGHFKEEGLDRVHSAFRLYRTGLDTTVLENKLTNWWTALEFMVRAESNIGNSVEVHVAPVLCLAYLPKHLVIHRNAFVAAGVALTDPVSGAALELKSMSLLELYDVFRRPDIQTIIVPAIAAQPYLAVHAAPFLQLLSDPKALHKQGTAHERRVRWHLQRLWRTRCDIVHSAGRQQSLALLCANLESYLKGTLMSLLHEVRRLPTLSGPKEFFERQAHSYAELQDDLAAGHDLVLRRHLAQY